jgi:hypothetical protein
MEQEGFVNVRDQVVHQHHGIIKREGSLTRTVARSGRKHLISPHAECWFADACFQRVTALWETGSLPRMDRTKLASDSWSKYHLREHGSGSDRDHCFGIVE